MNTIPTFDCVKHTAPVNASEHLELTDDEDEDNMRPLAGDIGWNVEPSMRVRLRFFSFIYYADLSLVSVPSKKTTLTVAYTCYSF